MPQKIRYVDLPFCFRGIHRGLAYARQPDFTSPLSQNAFPDDLREQRMRGARRGGAVKAYPTRVSNTSQKVRLLNSVRAVSTAGISTFEDPFDHIGGVTFLGGPWSAATWFGTGDLPIEIEPGYAAAFGGVFPTTGAAILDALDELDTTNIYTITIRTVDTAGYNGQYFIFLRMDDTTPNALEDGVSLGININEANEFITGDLIVYVSGVPTIYSLAETVAVDPVRPIDLSITVDGDDVTVRIDGTSVLTQTISAAAGDRMGFGLVFSGKPAVIDFFRVQFLTGSAIAESIRNFLVASAGGQLKRENDAGTDLEAISISPVVISSNKLLESVEYLGKLYIADYGPLKISGLDGALDAAGTALTSTSAGDWTQYGIDTDNDVVVISGTTNGTNDGTFKIASIVTTTLTLADASEVNGSTLTFRIEKAPLVYDPIANSLDLWVSDPPTPVNQVPVGNPHIAVFLDRIGLAGGMNAPHVYYFARRGSAFEEGTQDWDFGQTDEAAAFAGDRNNAGRIGAPITAMIPTNDDYLSFGTLGTFWVMRGDPTIGGRIDSISRKIGVVSGKAWTQGPHGEIWFLSRDGIYVIGPSAQGTPEELSEGPLPFDLDNINIDLVTVSIEYDVQLRGIHVYLGKELAGIGNQWFFHIDSKGWFLISFKDHDFVPFATHYYESDQSTNVGLLMGCRDGFIRRYDPTANTDTGNTVESFVLYGPIMVAENPRMIGVLHELTVCLDSDSGPLIWELYDGETAEQAVDKALDDAVTPLKSGQTRENSNGTSRLTHWKPRLRGKYIVMKLRDGSLAPWAIDWIQAGLWDVGKHKVR